jgi:hypothetical protein
MFLNFLEEVIWYKGAIHLARNPILSVFVCWVSFSYFREFVLAFVTENVNRLVVQYVSL